MPTREGARKPGASGGQLARRTHAPPAPARVGKTTPAKAPAAPTARRHASPQRRAASPDLLLSLALRGVPHPLASRVAAADTRFRLPTFADLKALYTNATLKIPESVIKDRVATLLGRMEKDKTLKTADPVATIVAKIFPAPGVIDETAFNAAVDVADRTRIYQSVVDAETVVSAADKPKLKSAMADAIALMQLVQKKDAGLTAVFGSKAATAKVNYGKAHVALGAVAKSIDTKVTTDYNLDAPQFALGGWASFAGQTMHLLGTIAQVKNVDDTKVTLIHESSHLADGSVTDRGYYGSDGFEALSENDKVTNAAHYEELPRRELGTSKFPGTMTPGVLASGAAPTWEDEIRRLASEYVRKAWDAAVDVHTLMRDVRKAALAGNTAPFATNKVVLLEISRLELLTIHEQDPAAAEVTALDVTLTEGVARSVSQIRRLLKTTPVSRIPAVFPTVDAENEATRTLVVGGAAATHGKLLGDNARDMKLLDWLVAHYHNVPSV